MSVFSDIAKGRSHCVSYLQKLDIEHTLSVRGIRTRKIFAPLLRLIYATQTKYRIIMDSRVKLPRSSKGRIFVINHRQADDIVIGAMANDQIYNYVGDFIDGAITRDQFWSLMKFKYPTHQIAFCTPQALRCLRFRGSEVVHD